MKYDVVALGELMIDFTDSGYSKKGNQLFEANAGGAPGNVLAMLAKLSRKVGFAAKIGDDMFGDMLISTLEDCGIATEGIIRDDTANTTLAFVRNAQDGEREFSFYRNPGADTRLSVADIDANMLQNCSIFHFGALSLTHSPAKEATQFALQTARNAGAVISFDPNLREMLWADLGEAKRQILWGCKACDILKIADNELMFVTEKRGINEGVQWLREKLPQIRMIFVTKGADGAEAFWDEHRIKQSAFLLPDTVDTTGAGDAFFGCCLSQILDLDLGKPDADKLVEILKFACAAAALITTKKGALCSMPNIDDINKLINI